MSDLTSRFLAPITGPEEAQALLQHIVDEYTKRGFFSPARTPVAVDDRAQFIDDELGPHEYMMAMIEVLRTDAITAQAARRLKAGPSTYLVPRQSEEEIERAIEESERDPPILGDDPPEADEEWKLLLVQEFLRHVDIELFLRPHEPTRKSSSRRGGDRRRRRRK